MKTEEKKHIPFIFLKKKNVRIAEKNRSFKKCLHKLVVALYILIINYIFRDDAEDAIDALDGRKFDGRELSVQYARYDRPDRDYGGGRGGGGDRGGRGGGRRSRSRSRGGRRGGRSPDRSRGRDRDRSRDRNRSRTPRDRSRDRKKSRSRSVDSDSRRRRHSGRSDRSDD